MESAPHRSLVRTALAAALLAALFASYGILKPLRDNVGQAFGRWRLPDVWLGTAVVTVLSTAVLGWLVSRWPRRLIAPLAFALCAAVTAGAWFAFDAHGGGKVQVDDPLGFWLAAGFYWWVSSYLPVGLALFWGLMAELHDDRQGRRTFGVIAFAGTLGQLGGAQFTHLFARDLGLLALLSVAVGLLALATVLSVAVRAVSPPRAGASQAGTRIGGRWWEGFAAAFRSPLLGGVLLYVGAQTLLSAMLALEIVDIVRGHFGDDQPGRTSFNAGVDFWSQAVTLALQALVVGPLLVRAGPGLALAAQPLAFALGFLALGLHADWHEAAAPILLVAAIDVARRSMNYGLAKPGRDLLFTTCTDAEKYKAKSAIDAAAFRVFDWGFAVLTNQWHARMIQALGPAATAGTAALAVPIALGWVWLAHRLGRIHRKRTGHGGALA